MNGFKKCSNGHFYKEDLSVCPYCPGGSGATDNSVGNDLNKIMGVKYDGKVRGEVYSEILPILEKAEKEESLNESVSIETTASDYTAMHPSDRARSFLERIGRG